MTHPTYTQQALCRYNLPRLKRIATELGVTPTLDKRAADTWVNAIITHQSTQLQKVDEQAIAQAELDHHIATQAQAVANVPLTTVEINFYHHEVFCGKELIAYIAYDHDDLITQPWLVMVNGEEKFRATTPARCQRFIQWHHQDGILRETFPAPDVIAEVPTILEISFYDQEAFVGDKLIASISYDHGNYQNLYWRVLVNNVEIFRDLSAARCHSYIKQQYQQGTLPVQEQLPEEVCTTGNEIMAQIFDECEKYGFEILDDGIYQNDVKLGEVGCTDGGWWFTRATDEMQQQQPCDSAMDAVWWLSMVDVLPHAEAANCEELLDRPFDELTPDEWQRLREYAPVAESRELVTA
ncbi:hypothetical protein GTQ43_31290 [Nostoc sp. KVJ3]|uniref:hypothetical protein n=1 Tax=Nostoc sp. KVJ3 TaxID=457945 RepID=UPI002237325B|nr:hypothetical protein [Nostoc sp. KVJ3]MCW5318085.1 hypothetical protein [Nostoc sp. KVJ3]